MTRFKIALSLQSFSLHRKATSLIGSRAVLVTAIDVDAARYWTSRGFHPTRDDALMLFMGMEELEITLGKLG
jgi:hypothetical protein